jgi:toxin FitB
VQWLLDTCVVSELTRKTPSTSVVEWLKRHGGEAVLTMVTVGEIQYGIERMPASRARNSLQLWFDGLCGQYSERTLPTDDAVWRAYGRLKASVESIGRPQEDLDLLIAATAAVHRLTVVTRNTKHFDDSGVKTFNPWSGH